MVSYNPSSLPLQAKRLSRQKGQTSQVRDRCLLQPQLPWILEGKLQGDRGMILTASKIDNHGKIAVQTGKVTIVGEFTNHDHLNSDEWVYEGETLSNFGKLEVNTYNRKTSLRRP